MGELITMPRRNAGFTAGARRNQDPSDAPAPAPKPTAKKPLIPGWVKFTAGAAGGAVISYLVTKKLDQWTSGKDELPPAPQQQPGFGGFGMLPMMPSIMPMPMAAAIPPAPPARGERSVSDMTLVELQEALRRKRAEDREKRLRMIEEGWGD